MMTTTSTAMASGLGAALWLLALPVVPAEARYWYVAADYKGVTLCQQTESSSIDDIRRRYLPPQQALWKQRGGHCDGEVAAQDELVYTFHCVRKDGSRYRGFFLPTRGECIAMQRRWEETHRTYFRDSRSKEPPGRPHRRS